ENRKFGKMEKGSLSSIIRSFKSASSKRINEINGTIGTKVWQSRFYDHIIRNDNDLHRIRTYIQNNPFKWELDEYFES
ncbi:MAG: transposase, partial [Ignavibacterium sp.]